MMVCWGEGEGPCPEPDQSPAGEPTSLEPDAGGRHCAARVAQLRL